MEGTAEATYRQWLTRQYAAFLESLRGLVGGGAPPAVQVPLPSCKLLVRLPTQARECLSFVGPIQRRFLPFKNLRCQAKAAVLPAEAGWQ